MNIHVVLVLLQLISQKWISALICSRYPSNTLVPKSPVDENFAILINNNPQTYILGQEYNITLNAYNGHRYISFSLALENDNGYFNMHEDLGQFKINDPIETRYSPNCINMVDSTNTHPKVRSEVTWIAPTDPNSGCVLIRATVLQHRDVWFMDDGGLTRRICQAVVDEVESRRTYDGQSSQCCACDEARYELTFQGVWNRNLHPKDFPPKGWIARFGEIIGAAHIADYRFWRDGEMASDGMKEYAEHGSSQTIEKEFNSNFQEGIIRTIIKARGPSFPNLNGISMASVRVDPKHNLISLASKIDPSPDWFVGISGLKLCMPNCTWLEERIIQLYPWDAGTDAGPSYTSADQPQMPPDVIRRMRSNYPNDPRSPFYDENGAAMTPFATLTVKRQRLYERTCEDKDSSNDNIPRECHTHPWTYWSECSARCGDGRSYRTRVYKQPELAKIYNCNALITLRQDRECKGENCFGPMGPGADEAENLYGEPDFGAQRSTAECAPTPWGDWSECSNTCGEGTIVRRREFRNMRTKETCEAPSNRKTVDFKKCQGRVCLDDSNDKSRRPMGGDNIDDAEENLDEYWNSADGIRERGTQQYGRRQENWSGGQIGRDDELQHNQIWNGNRRGTLQRAGYGNQNFNGLNIDNENEEMEIENPEAQRKEFEVGDLHTGYAETNNQRVFNTGNNKNSVNEHHFNRQQQFSERLSQDPNSATGFQQVDVPTVLAKVVPDYCFDKLHIFNCLDPTVIGNFWFYNYCEDECMLYAADRCDRNENKFTSLEACESMCQRPNYMPYLKYQQERACTTKMISRQRSEKRRKNDSWKRY